LISENTSGLVKESASRRGLGEPRCDGVDSCSGNGHGVGGNGRNANWTNNGMRRGDRSHAQLSADD